MLRAEENIKDIKTSNTRTVQEIVDDVNSHTDEVRVIRIVVELLNIISYLVDRLAWAEKERFNH